MGVATTQNTFTSFDYPGGAYTYGLSINSSGQIAGFYLNGGWHGYVRSSDGSTFSSFDVPGANGGITAAHGINDSGQVVGTFPYDAAGSGFLRSSDGSNYTTIDNPNSSGTSSGGAFGSPTRGINNSGEIVGWYVLGNSAHGFLLGSDGSSFTSFDAPNAAAGFTFPNAINNLGQIVGDYYDGSFHLHGFLRSSDGSTYTTIDVPNSVDTFPVGINDSGQVVGFYYVDGTNYHGFLRSSDGSTYTTIDYPGALAGGSTTAQGINNAGQVVGVYSDSSGVQHSYVMSPAVPTTIDQCKNGGWSRLGRPGGAHFKNQGDCIQYVNTGK